MAGLKNIALHVVLITVFIDAMCVNNQVKPLERVDADLDEG